MIYLDHGPRDGDPPRLCQDCHVFSITAAIVSGAVTAAALGTAAAHIKGFVEGHPWWEDPVGDLKNTAVSAGTGALTGGLGAVGGALGTALGSTAAQAGGAAGPGSVAGQAIPRAVAELGKTGIQAAGQGAIGAARAAIGRQDPLMGAATGAAGSFAGGLAGDAFRAGASQLPAGLPQQAGNFLARPASSAVGDMASRGVAQGMAPSPMAPPPMSTYRSGYPYNRSIYRR